VNSVTQGTEGTARTALMAPSEAAERGALACELTEASLHELYAKLECVIESAESTMSLIRELAGPSPSFLPQHLLTMLNMGTGYFRYDRDVLAALFRRRNARQRAES